MIVESLIFPIGYFFIGLAGIKEAYDDNPEFFPRWFGFDNKISFILSTLTIVFWGPLTVLFMAYFILKLVFYHLPVQAFKFWRDLPDRKQWK